jgi:POLQ-like helicase
MRELPMKPEKQSHHLLRITRSKAKMYEYKIPLKDHINVAIDPDQLIVSTIGMLGEIAARICTDSANLESLTTLKKNLLFSAHFFDSYLQSKLREGIDLYLILVGSASYYLCDLPGSSNVLADQLKNNFSNSDMSELEKLLFWLLIGDFSSPIALTSGKYQSDINKLSTAVCLYFENGENVSVQKILQNLRKIIYDEGNAHELLFVDVSCAIVIMRIKNSCWNNLPNYTGLTKVDWRFSINKLRFKELWPSQKLLGENDIFLGKSAIIQMPTSAGKTKSIEIIIRSAFLANRASIAVIVAPFRALCNEITNGLTEAFIDEDVSLQEISDVPQSDVGTKELISKSENVKTILVLTPEKLLYILRQTPDLANNIGLIVYDEGHQFDNGLRGVTYELLLSSLKSMIPEKTQIILISAVIINAETICEWLLGDKGIVISGNDLLPTDRSIAFSSWKLQRGILEFIDKNNPDTQEFFVPRVIEKISLTHTSREKARHFPEKNDGKSIAIYLGMKLVTNGSIAIYCGRKDTVVTLCKIIIESYNRELNLPPPLRYSDSEEVNKLYFLHKSNLGEDNPITQCSKIGIFSHSNNTPHGLRLAIEYAMQKSFIKFVICTSTLSQGVNLPIRYLLVTSIYQAGKQIKVRDFHNLIGRAGRSGKYTEGSIIFADPETFDNRTTISGRYRWEKFKILLNLENSELCASTILKIFDPISSEKKLKQEINILDYARAYLNNADDLNNQWIRFANENLKNNYTIEGVSDQLQEKAYILSSIQGYLMAHWDDDEMENNEAEVLAKKTLTYDLCNPAQKIELIELFKLLAQNIKIKVPLSEDRQAFGKTLYGLNVCIEIRQWLSDNLFEILFSSNQEQIFEIIWPLFEKYITNKTFKKIIDSIHLKNLLYGWINGKSYIELYDDMFKAGVKYKWGSKQRNITLEIIIDICDNALGYQGTLLLNAIIELLSLQMHWNLISYQNILMLQKRIKYGLCSEACVALYEIGFSDRVIALELSLLLGDFEKVDKNSILKMVVMHKDAIENSLIKYPSYYSQLLQRLSTVKMEP